MNNELIYRKAQSLVSRLGTRDPQKIAKALNIHIVYMADTTTLLGMYKVINNHRFIFLPSNIGDLRNTVLAHEIGHDQLHRKDTSDVAASFHESKVFSNASRYEVEANIFAAHLLISNEDVIDLIEFYQDDSQLAQTLGVDINLLNLKISEMAKMRMIGVSANRPDSTFLRNYKPLGD